ncbi:MAG TPA: hypothetical protein VFJ90_01130 [Candidatus Didemnitutus sp.]|nr:hypothetical protein [Candidatus Didemnitutus sp.]
MHKNRKPVAIQRTSLGGGKSAAWRAPRDHAGLHRAAQLRPRATVLRSSSPAS